MMYIITLLFSCAYGDASGVPIWAMVAVTVTW